jgi:hypothetical protein
MISAAGVKVLFRAEQLRRVETQGLTTTPSEFSPRLPACFFGMSPYLLPTDYYLLFSREGGDFCTF